ncbi:hypothetical protein GGR54DRAFT_591874 [Hypoxylon sp. NC1633]|nr:hypothetical protein GGR54DRAFT_591874 [Hypoxylon sp. NC1633]
MVCEASVLAFSRRWGLGWRCFLLHGIRGPGSVVVFAHWYLPRYLPWYFDIGVYCMLHVHGCVAFGFPSVLLSLLAFTGSCSSRDRWHRSILGLRDGGWGDGFFLRFFILGLARHSIVMVVFGQGLLTVYIWPLCI